MLQCYCAMSFIKRTFIVEKVEGEFENIREQVIKQSNASTLHDKDTLFMCKVSIPQIVTTLNKTMIPRDVYKKLLSLFYD